MKQVILLAGICVALGACVSGPTPFDNEVNASNEVSQTIATLDGGKQALLTFGANWCSDSRALAAAYQTEPLQSLLLENFEVVFIDVGKRDLNMDLAAKYKAPVMGGIPSLAVVDAKGALLFSSQATDLYTAADLTQEQIHSYFETLLTQLQ